MLLEHIRPVKFEEFFYLIYTANKTLIILHNINYNIYFNLFYIAFKSKHYKKNRIYIF